MHCDKCGFDNPKGMRFCGQCAAPLSRECPACSFSNPPDFSYCGQCATALIQPLLQPLRNPAPSSTAQPHRGRLPIEAEAERRQLTVLFCDIVGSSQLAAHIDPEDLRDIMRDYRSICSNIIRRFDGYIAQYLGDGILVYFGYPRAHEDDAQRAVRAGLEIVEQIPQIQLPRSAEGQQIFQVRVGIHTGLVVIGEIGGGDKRAMALGETPNIAARLQDFAAPNTIVISAATHRLLNRNIVCEALGRHKLKGFDAPMELYAAQRLVSHLRFRFNPQHDEPGIFGREQEITLLLERLTQARKGVGQIILLGSEAGMGKTRITRFVCEHAVKEPLTLLELAGSPYYQNSYLYPVIELLRRKLHLAGAGDRSQHLSRLEKFLTALGLPAEHCVPLLADLLSIPLDERYAPQVNAKASTPQQKKHLTQDLLMQILQRLTQRHFVLLIVEDLHWVDPSTMELLSQLANQPGLGHCFGLFTFRNEFIPPWPTRSNLVHMALNRLTRQQSGDMIRQLCRQKSLPPEVFENIISKADGIPFFIEEITTALITSDHLDELSDRFELASPGSPISIPTSLQDFLMSRLDRLGEEKELAQLSSILGREFEHELLSRVSARDEQSLGSGLDRLINADLFYQRGQRPKAMYSFRHTLLRDAAYASLLKRTRQKYHQRIAELLQKHFPNTIVENPELMAYHCTEGGDLPAALRYWLAAGKRAMQQSANIEAINHLHKGIALLGELPDSTDSRALELAYQINLGLAVMMSKGYGVPEVEQAYARAKQLCHDITDTQTIFPVLCGLWEYYVVRADLGTAQQMAIELEQLATATGNAELVLEAQRALGTTQLWRGDVPGARQYLNPASCPRDINAILQPRSTAPHSHDNRVAILANTGCVFWLSGQPDIALEYVKNALQLARQITHPFSQAYALNFACTLTQLRGDRQGVAYYADMQITLCENFGFPFWAAMGRMFSAWANSPETPEEVTIAAYKTALHNYESSGNRIARSYFLALFATLYLEIGKPRAAADIVSTALRDIEITDERFFQAELLRLKAVLMREQPNAPLDAVETVLTQALNLASSQQVWSLSLRVAIDLAMLHRQAGRQTRAAALLAEQLKRISGGDATLDVMTARQLLTDCGYVTP